ncbi:cellulose binding domain-containing protein [Acetivibrio straminisolvens]|jgi:hypothetical protein|uniref:cellulose binding domain-containing protein n=1 Tax=Acetivibrio straminisolvens TaxID=253314 RepID=UPI00223F5C1D|nr:cellulose binding domain-containing protein [Acetivibrio straminisolvens]
MRKQRRISIMVAVFFIIQCLSLATFASNSFASTASVSVEMYNSNTQTYSNTISPNFKIYNTGSTSINLSTIKVRYYYTSDGITGQTYICDYAGNQSNIASSTVGQIVSMTNQTSDADTYLEIYFTSSAGVVLPGSYVEVKGRIVSYNYQNYTQSNDYSFNPTATYYQSSNKVTIYVNGVLKGGTEPISDAGQGELPLRYEAEEGVVTVSSMVKSDPYCSNGQYVGDIGVNNTLSINAIIPETDTYTLTIYYRTATNKALRFTQSTGTSYAMVCPGNGNTRNIGSISKEVSLQKGACQLIFSNPSATAPEIDFITITKDLVPNTDFESGANGQPIGWTAKAMSGDTCTWDMTGGVDNSKALSITSSAYRNNYGSSYFESAEIQLEPYKYYRAEVLVRTQITGFEEHNTFAGGNISVRLKASNKRDYETHWGMISKGVINNHEDWATAVINFQAPYDGKVKFRLNNCDAIGTCWFDDFKLYTDDSMVKMEGSKIMFGVRRADIIDSGISSDALDEFISTYDRLVDENESLTGLDYETHFENEKIKVVQRINLPWVGEASTRSYIWWNYDAVKDDFIHFKNESALSWALPHEIGHQFDIDRWNFDGEFWGSFKGYAALSRVGCVVYMGNTYYGKKGTPGLWYYFEFKDLDKLENNEYSGDFIIGLLAVRSATSWNSFTQTFQYFADENNYIPTNNYEKFLLFLNKLDEYENRPIGYTLSLFTEQQLNVIEYQLKKYSGDVSLSEAETANYQNLAVVNNINCSGGKYVEVTGTNNLGYYFTRNESGKYLIKITYLSGTYRKLDVVINGTTYQVECTQSGWDTPRGVFLVADLESGLNSIIIKNSPGYQQGAVGIDCIEVAKKYTGI